MSLSRSRKSERLGKNPRKRKGKDLNKSLNKHMDKGMDKGLNKGRNNRMSNRPNTPMLLVAFLLGSIGALVALHWNTTAAIVAGIWCATATLAVLHRLRGRSQQAVVRKQHTQAVDIIADASASLNAGAVTATIFRTTIEEWPRHVHPGRIATVWDLTRALGIPASILCKQLAEHMRSDARLAARRQAADAPLHATSAVLISLPFLGIALGYGLGIDPLRFLLTQPIGIGCLVGVSALQLAGMAWVGHISTKVAPSC